MSYAVVRQIGRPREYTDGSFCEFVDRLAETRDAAAYVMHISPRQLIRYLKDPHTVPFRSHSFYNELARARSIPVPFP